MLYPLFVFLTLLWCFNILSAALFLLDNYLEVYLWQSCEASVSQHPLWDKEKKCAMETALQYCKGEFGFGEKSTDAVQKPSVSVL